jgi:hypothetical protein
MRVARAAAVVVALFAVLPPRAASVAATSDACTIPKGTHVTIRLAGPLSSSESHTGEPFAFYLARPIEAPGCAIPPEGADGHGTVYLAGASGSGGHEGDLTLRLDSVRTFDGRYIVFDDQRIGINGRNRKLESGLLGFVPYAGFAAGFIRGSDIHLDALAIVETVLERPATFSSVAPPPPGPVPTPHAKHAAAQTSSPTPSAIPSETPVALPSETPTAAPSASPA